MSNETPQSRRIEVRMDMLQAVFDMGVDGQCLVDRTTMRYLAMNPAFCRILGCSYDEAMHSAPHEHSISMNRETLEAIYDTLIHDAPQAQSDETTFKQPDGSVKWVGLTRKALKSGDDWVIAVTVRDLTERNLVQSRLDRFRVPAADVAERSAAQEKLERFRAALDLSAEGIVLIDRESMTYLDVNETMCRMFGYSREEYLRREPHEMGRAESAADLGRRYDAVIAGEPGVVTIEKEYVRADGSPFPGESTYHAIQLSGKWIIAITTRDVTERQAAQQKLERFRKALDLSADAIVLIDRASMRFIDVNQTSFRMIGYTREEYLARNPEEQTEFTREELEALYDELIAKSPRVVSHEGLTQRSDGTKFPSEVSRQAICSGGRWIIAITVRDLTQKKEIEAQLRRKVEDLVRSNEELEHFAYVASHDLQEPLRMIGSYTQLLARRYADKFDDDGREFIGFVVGGAQRMQQLIQDLLVYSRTGRVGDVKPVALERAFRDALLNLEGLIARAQAVVECGPLPEVMGERSFLTQLFQNLVGNAIKFRAAAAPHVRVSARREAGEWVITVADNGIGIEPQYFDRVFVIFQRLHGREKYDGTGVGLAICKKVVERHGGRIWVEPNQDGGHGTAFHFTIPVMKAAPPDTGKGLNEVAVS